MRGPGESPFQLRRAPMMASITILKRKLKEMQKRRERTRARRPWPVVTLVGYTNAGKSTLLNALTSAEAYVDDRLFATLDTKSRLLFLPNAQKVMLTDTVGFIRNLPHGLVASFRSTLEEIRESDLLLIVAEASHKYVREHLQVVYDTLAAIHADQIPRLLLMNKADRLANQAEPAREFPQAIFISALKHDGLPQLKERIAQAFSADKNLEK